MNLKDIVIGIVVFVVVFVIVALIMIMLTVHFVDIYASCENCTTLLNHYDTYNTTNIVGNVWLK